MTRDGKTAAWGGYRRKLILWDLENNQKRSEINCPTSIFHVRFAPDGKSLAVAGMERLIRLYDARSGVELPGLVGSMMLDDFTEGQRAGAR